MPGKKTLNLKPPRNWKASPTGALERRSQGAGRAVQGMPAGHRRSQGADRAAAGDPEGSRTTRVMNHTLFDDTFENHDTFDDTAKLTLE